MIFNNIDICNPQAIIENSSIKITEDKFEKVSPANEKDGSSFDGFTAYPGLINAHDHLLGAYLPKVGNGPYLNWRPWDDDLKASKIYAERSLLSHEEIYRLADYRQILSGVTTVSDHIPHIVNEKFISKSHIHILDNYSLSHEFSSYDLQWGESNEVEIKKAKENDHIFFLTHIEEGFDQEAINGIKILKQSGGLFEKTVLIHCISCSEEDIISIKKAGSSMVWSPCSNIFMFDKTANIKSFLDHGVNVCLGTDSPMSGGENLLYEMAFAKDLFGKLFKEKLHDQDLFRMVTSNPAEAFLQKNIGSIEEDKQADLLIMKNNKKDAYRRITSAQMEDVEILIRKGKVLYCKEKYKKLLEENSNIEDYQLVNLKEKYPYYLIGKPLDLLNGIRAKVGFEKELSFFPVSTV